MMTLEDMQCAICDKMPHIFRVDEDNHCYWSGEYIGKSEDGLAIVCDFPVTWNTEGLQVCHEAEKLLTLGQWRIYSDKLMVSVRDSTQFPEINGSNVEARYRTSHATYEQKLTALCQIWFPENFV